MKYISNLFGLCLIFVTLSTHAQVVKDSITLKDLEVPNAPGFMLMDNAPTLIERPMGSKAFSMSILNAIEKSNGLPNNYAIELTPFWYFKHPKMSSYKYIGYNPEKEKQLPFAQLKKLSLNFSYKGNNDTVRSTPNHYFAVGFRTTLIMVRTKKQIEQIKKANDECVLNLRSIDEQLTAAGILYPLPTDDTAAFNKKLKEFYVARDKFISEHTPKVDAKNSLKNALSGKPLFAIDMATGYNASFLDNSFSQNKFGRFGTWLTASFSQKLSADRNPYNYINIYALGRYILDGQPIDSSLTRTTYIDAGGKLEFEFDRLSIAYECVYRFNNINQTYRSNGILKYKVSSSVYLTAAFGKNFGFTNDLISMFGLNWGIGSGNEKTAILK